MRQIVTGMALAQDMNAMSAVTSPVSRETASCTRKYAMGIRTARVGTTSRRTASIKRCKEHTVLIGLAVEKTVSRDVTSLHTGKSASAGMDMS
jgi:hypothetical protein